MTKPTEIKITEATEDQLRVYARDVLGLVVSASDKAAALRAKIAQATDATHIPVYAAPTDGRSSLPQAQAQAVDADDEFVTVVVERSEEDAEPVFASVNGRGIRIPRGVPARIRKCYEHVLKNAMRDVFHQTKEGELIKTTVSAYPYHVVPG